jgi:hypothetical protein
MGQDFFGEIGWGVTMLILAFSLALASVTWFLVGLFRLKRPKCRSRRDLHRGRRSLKLDGRTRQRVRETQCLSCTSAGAGRDVVGILRGAVSGQLMVSGQAARSIG